MFVCESRYAYKTKSFKKIKVSLATPPLSLPLVPRVLEILDLSFFQNWVCYGTPPTLTQRPTPLSSIPRVPSVFATSGNTKTMPTKDQAKKKPTPPPVVAEPKMTGPLDVSYVGTSLKNVVMTVSNPDSNIYYEQYCIDEDFFRLGKLWAVEGRGQCWEGEGLI